MSSTNSTSTSSTAASTPAPTTSMPEPSGTSQSSGTSTPQPQIFTKPSRKPRCGAKDCKALAQPIVGDCGFCQKHFCGKHRMLESHNCSGLEDCKKVERQRNSDRLTAERTVAIRGL